MTVAEIESMDRAALVVAWCEVLRTPVPKGLSKALMAVSTRQTRRRRPARQHRNVNIVDQLRDPRVTDCNRVQNCCANGTA